MVAVAPSILVDSSLIAPLRTPIRTQDGSGFRGVYKHKNGWRGVIKYRGRLIRVCKPQRLPSQAAVKVARWLENRLGPNWPDVINSCNRYWSQAPWRVWWSEKHGGWLLRVWEEGKPTEVVHLRKIKGTNTYKPTSRLRVFPTREAAESYIPTWLNHVHGLMAFMVMFRHEAKQVPHNNGRLLRPLAAAFMNVHERS
jgi:hypothetical protein